MMKDKRKSVMVGVGVAAASVALAMLAACATQSAPSVGYVGAVTPGLLTSMPAEIGPGETPSDAPADASESAAAAEDMPQTDEAPTVETVSEEQAAQDGAPSSPSETPQPQTQARSSQENPVSDPKPALSHEQPSASAKAHEHFWEPVLEKREVVDVAAYEETQYKTEERIICSVCGADITNGNGQGRSILEHGKVHTLAGEGGGTYSTTKSVPCGTISHPAQTHYEEVTVGYRCSCGAAK